MREEFINDEEFQVCSIIARRLSLEGIEKKIVEEDKRQETKDRRAAAEDGLNSGLEASIKRSRIINKNSDFLKKNRIQDCEVGGEWRRGRSVGL